MAAEPIPTTQAFQQIRPYLFTVAYRMTGSASDAEDLVQDAWIRYLDAGSPRVDSMRAWLTTTVSRLALDHLKSARVRRERYIGEWLPEPVLTASLDPGPEETVEQREGVSLAYLTLLERLTPDQRVVYVLREGLGLPYDEIAGHIGKTAAACRQIHRRAETRLAGEHRSAIAPGERHRDLAERFVAAVQRGDAGEIAALLAEDVVWIADGGGKRLALQRPVLGADRVSRGWAGFGRKWAESGVTTLTFVHVNGAAALLMREPGAVDSVIAFDVRDDRITAIRSIRNPDKLRHLTRALFARHPA